MFYLDNNRGLSKFRSCWEGSSWERRVNTDGVMVLRRWARWVPKHKWKICLEEESPAALSTGKKEGRQTGDTRTHLEGGVGEGLSAGLCPREGQRQCQWKERWKWGLGREFLTVGKVWDGLQWISHQIHCHFYRWVNWGPGLAQSYTALKWQILQWKNPNLLSTSPLRTFKTQK